MRKRVCGPLLRSIGTCACRSQGNGGRNRKMETERKGAARCWGWGPVWTGGRLWRGVFLKNAGGYMRVRRSWGMSIGAVSGEARRPYVYGANRYRGCIGYKPPSKTPRTSSTVRRSARNGHRSVSSVSCGSLNQDETGTALLG